MRFLILFFILPLFSKPIEQDFDTLMGKNTRVFRFVKLEEDKINYKFLRQIFNERRDPTADMGLSINKTLHFIWLGPASYPRASLYKLAGWLEKHPEFSCKLWTDRQRHLSLEGLEETIISENYLDNFKDEYLISNNYAEKSDLLRYEILFKEGGVYIDHDVTCIKSIAPLLNGHDFFATLSPLATPVVYPNTIRIRNSIIGFCKHHPLFESLFPLIKKRFSEIQDNGFQREQILEAVTKRTFIPFHDCALQELQKKDSTGIIFPVGYFTKVLKLKPLFADESMDGLWWREQKSHHEELLEGRVQKLEKRLKYLSIACLLLFSLTLFRRKKYATTRS
jgi:hypothetical protein